MTDRTENLAKFLILAICSSVLSMTLLGQVCGLFQPLQSQHHPGLPSPIASQNLT